MIRKCQNATIVYDLEAAPFNIGFGDHYPVKNLIRCQNDADHQSPRGTWYCGECWPQAPSGRRRWTVRPGTHGLGPILFEVYAATMEEARESVVRSTTDFGDLGFTVHAIQRGDIGAGTLAGAAWYGRVPAPDFPRELAHA